MVDKSVRFFFTVLTILGIFIIWAGLNFGSAAVESYTKNDVIGNLTYSEWAEKQVEWWISLPTKSIPSTDPATGGPCPTCGCLAGADNQNKTIFLMSTYFADSIRQKCSFKADQSILIPLLAGECDTGDKENVGKPFTELLGCAYEGDKGNAHMIVKVDNLTIADTKASVHRTPSPNNLTEVESKDLFDVNVRPGSQFIESGDYNGPGKFKGVVHGWYVFLKPLGEGNHVISYYIKLTGTEPNIKNAVTDYEADVTYNVRVEK